MQQHSVPQNVMSVEFQLIGNMTIKQFAYVAAGGIIAFIAYSLPFPDVLKWPLVLSFFGLGAAFAFAPINDIPLDRWIVNFIKVIYSPTKRVWRKEPKSLGFLLPEFSAFLQSQAPSASTQSKDRSRLEEFLATLKPPLLKTSLDSLEDTYLSKLNFGISLPVPVVELPQVPLTIVAAPPSPLEEPRAVEEAPEVKENIERIASMVSFRPVVTVRLPDKSIFVKPVSNVRVRSLHPLPALEGTIVLPVRGEKVFTVSDILKKRLSEKVQTIKVQENSLQNLSSGDVVQVKTISRLEPKPGLVNKQIINPYKTVPYNEVENELEISKIKSQIASELNSTVENFKRIAAENRRLNGELQRLKQTQAQSLTTASKSELDKVVSDYKQQIERLRAEREGLFEQFSALRGQAQEFQEKAKESSSLEQELAELRSQISVLEQEKLQALSHADILKESLEGLQQEIQSQFNEIKDETLTKAPLAPTTTKPHIKILTAKKAFGKMIPVITSIPNVINGIVKDKEGLLLADVIIVVKDKDEEPARALKTNKVGQFAISTPLPNGSYLIELEKDGYEFDIIEVKLKGAILEPIEIKSK